MKNENYMQDIYDVIYAPEVEYNDDGIEYLDDPIDDEIYFGFDDELAWADDITYLDEPYEDEFDIANLGEGFIPLPQGDYQEELVVIDEHYILDECEEDLIANYERPAVETKQDIDYSLDEIYNLLDGEDEIELDINNVESLIKFPVQQEVTEELKVSNLSEEDDKIAKAIAREHMDNVKAGEAAGALFGDVENPDDNTSWVDDDDPFGNDINVIIAEDPNKEVIEDDFVEGSFQDWLNQQNQ
jgi:hypothetical protein